MLCWLIKKPSPARIPSTGWSPLHLYTHELMNKWGISGKIVHYFICVKVTTSNAKKKQLLVEEIGRSCCQTAPHGQLYWCSRPSLATSPYNGAIWNTIRQPDNCTSGKGQIFFKLVYGFRSPWMCFLLRCRVGEKVDAILFMPLNTHYRKQETSWKKQTENKIQILWQ